MKNNTENGYVFRAIVAILIGVVLVLCVGIAVSGWQSETDGENSGDNGNTTENADNPDGDTDEDTDGTADNNTQNTQKPDIPEVPAPPEFTNSLTGLECKAEDMSKLPYVFVTDTSAPLYGISDSELVVEIPTENVR